MSRPPPQAPPADWPWAVTAAFQMGAGHYVQHAVAACSVKFQGGAAFALVETVPDPERTAAFAHAICNAFCETVAKEAARTRPPLQPAKALHLLRIGVEAKGVGDDLRSCPDETALARHDTADATAVHALGGVLLGVLADQGGLAVAFVGEPILWLLGPEGVWGKCDAVLRHGRMLRDEMTPDRPRLLREVLFAELPDVRCAYAVTSALVRDASHATVVGDFQVPRDSADAERAVHQFLRTSLGRQRDNPETSDGVGVVCAVRCVPEAAGRLVGRPAAYWAMTGAFGIGALVGAAVLQNPLYPAVPMAAPQDPASVTESSAQPAPSMPMPSAASAAVDDLLPDCPVEGAPIANPAATNATPTEIAP